MGNKIYLLLGSIFLAIGLIVGMTFSVAGIFEGIKQDNSVAVDAEIEEITSYRTEDNKLGHEVYVSFINPKTEQIEKRRINFYDSSMYEGKEIEIFYNRDSNTIFTGSMSIMLLAMGIGFLVLFGGVGAGLLIFFRRGMKKVKYLKETGIKVLAKVIDIGEDNHIIINRQPATILICEYEDLCNGLRYTFQSGPILKNGLVAKYPIGSMIEVYIEEKDFGNFYVAI